MDSEDSDQTGWMSRLICLRWAHSSVCWFCRDAAQLYTPESFYNTVFGIQAKICISYPNLEYIRIFNGCQVRIENSVTRVTVRHREA